jgi:apolipoprotein N-acyltransferase
MNLMKLSRLDAIAFFAGLSLPVAFAPFDIPLVAIFSPALLLYTWQQATPRLAFQRGYLFGIGFFTVGISWVYISIHVFGQAPIALSIFITAIFSLYLSLFTALQGYCLTKLAPEQSVFKILLLFPCSWVLFEGLRGWLFTGFPWLFLGYAQTDSWLRGVGPLFGVYGASFISTLLSSLLLIILQKRDFPTYSRILAKMGMALIIIASFFLSKVNWTQATGKPLKATLIQGNIEQNLKWQAGQFLKTFKLYTTYTQQHWSSDLIIWPEAAITLPLSQSWELLEALSTSAKKNKSTLLIGVPIVEGDAAYNSLIAIGNGSGIYHKRHLVPFGEYIPLKPLYEWMLQIFHIPMSNFQPGTKEQLPLLAGGIPIGPYICYEVAYPIEFLLFLPNAKLLLTITDDSWFGHSIAAKQHLQMAQFRALETGRYLLYSGNTGITAIINDKGQVVASLPAFKEGSLTAWTQPMCGRTPWVIWKNYPLFGIMLITLSLHFFRRFRYAQSRSLSAWLSNLRQRII